MVVDQDLLFGVLALQANVIDGRQFSEIHERWSRSTGVSFATLLLEKGWLSPEKKEALDTLVAGFDQVHVSHDSQAGTLFDNRFAPSHPPGLRGSLFPTEIIGEDAGIPKTMEFELPPDEQFTLRRLYAKGGIGQVWLAQDNELKREVALKELRSEYIDNPAVVHRFVAEARITGQLQHPSIVPVYCISKNTQTGRPFYTMRLVGGRTLLEAIEDYHQRHHGQPAGAAMLRGLLTRFVSVCQAVAFAHSQGIIHRDLKPHNVMIGDFGEAIVLDWGLAKIVGQEDSKTESTLPTLPRTHPDLDLTLEGQVLGTLGYMSPEQATGDSSKLDYSSDVYSLGAILFAILTGRPPFISKLHDDMLEMVRNGVVTPPKTLIPSIHPALNAICLKALHRRRADRHPSATALARDVEHWLADEPVAAYPEPWTCRLGRWTRRNRSWVMSAGATLCMAVILLTLSTILLNRARGREHEARLEEETQKQLARAAEERAKVAQAKAEMAAAQAQAVNQFLTQDLLFQADPQKNPVGAKITVRDLLELADRKVGDSPHLVNQPEVEASVRGIIGLTYNGLGLYPQAERQLRKAAELRRDKLGADEPETLKAFSVLASALFNQNKLTEAEQIHRRVIEVLSRLQPGLEESQIRSSMTSLGIILRRQGQFVEAEKHFRELVSRYEIQLGKEHLSTLNAMNSLANVLMDQGKHVEAEPLVRKNVDVRRRIQGEEHPQTLLLRANLGLLLTEIGNHVEAETLLRQVHDQRSKVLGVDHHMTANTLEWLAIALHKQNKLAESTTALTQALAIYRKKLAPAHPDLANCLRMIGRVKLDENHPQEAELFLREALEAFRKGSSPTYAPYALAEEDLGVCLMRLDRFSEAEPLMLSAHQHLAAIPKGELKPIRQHLAKLYERWGKPDQAKKWREMR